MEIWKVIKGFENYQISNFGKIKSLGNNASKKEKILIPSIDYKGYLTIGLCKNGIRKRFKIHQLVAIVFLNHKPCGHKLVVDHIDNNKLNNKFDNLQIISNRENCSKDKKNKTSLYVGVCWYKKTNKWLSCIRINGKKKHLGLFKNEIDAHFAYKNALLKYGI